MDMEEVYTPILTVKAREKDLAVTFPAERPPCPRLLSISLQLLKSPSGGDNFPSILKNCLDSLVDSYQAAV